MDSIRTFAGIGKEYADYANSGILLQPIPFDGTSTWGKGADQGFEAFLEASENMELYDIETGVEVYRKGIHIMPKLEEGSSPRDVYEAIKKNTRNLLKTGKYLTFLGGEHSISIGIIEEYCKVYQNLTVLQLDAHADLRERYQGSKYNHACSMHEANKKTNLIQVGIRSMDYSEKENIKPGKCFLAQEIHANTDWVDTTIKQMTDDVYLTIDLDVFDPSIMPSTGTPEPGGLDWYTTLHYLKKVFMLKNVVGFDIVELAPIEGLKAPNFLVAKLYYTLLSYKFRNEVHRNGKK